MKYKNTFNIASLRQSVEITTAFTSGSPVRRVYELYRTMATESLPSLPALLISYTSRRLAMLNVFLRESDLQQVPNKTHKFCNVGASKFSSYFLKTNIIFYCIYQYFMSINSFFNTVSVSRYSRPITVTRDPL
jgi:hypothetical protein